MSCFQNLKNLHWTVQGGITDEFVSTLKKIVKSLKELKSLRLKYRHLNLLTSKEREDSIEVFRFPGNLEFLKICADDFHVSHMDDFQKSLSLLTNLIDLDLSFVRTTLTDSAVNHFCGGVSNVKT